MKRLVRRVCNETAFESFVIGCSSSCNSLLGPALWRKWDKPLIQAVAKEIHGMGRLLHIHFHGSSAETLMDFVDTGADCVCPFERPPGGDIRGIDGLREVRRALSDRVTMNGNVHTGEPSSARYPGRRKARGKRDQGSLRGIAPLYHRHGRSGRRRNPS
jgi:hypothetical protein